MTAAPNGGEAHLASVGLGLDTETLARRAEIRKTAALLRRILYLDGVATRAVAVALVVVYIMCVTVVVNTSQDVFASCVFMASMGLVGCILVAASCAFPDTDTDPE